MWSYAMHRCHALSTLHHAPIAMNWAPLCTVKLAKVITFHPSVGLLHIIYSGKIRKVQIVTIKRSIPSKVIYMGQIASKDNCTPFPSPSSFQPVQIIVALSFCLFIRILITIYSWKALSKWIDIVSHLNLISCVKSSLHSMAWVI